MASYTLELFRVMALRDNKIGLDDYPIYGKDEAEQAANRERLNKLIMMTYATREIGSETIDLFVYRMRTKMFQVMPYYNKLYESETLKFDAITNTKIATKSKRDSTGTEASDSKVNVSGTEKGESHGVSSTFPQVGIEVGGQYGTEGTDATSGGETKSETDQFTQADNRIQEDIDSETSGYQGDPNALLASHRDNMLNIDMTVATELRPLFLMVWEVSVGPDSFTALPNLQGN